MNLECYDKIRFLGVDNSQEATLEHPRDRIIVYEGFDLGKIELFPGFNATEGGRHFISEYGLVEGRDNLRKNDLNHEAYFASNTLLRKFYEHTCDLLPIHETCGIAA